MKTDELWVVRQPTKMMGFRDVDIYLVKAKTAEDAVEIAYTASIPESFHKGTATPFAKAYPNIFTKGFERIK